METPVGIPLRLDVARIALRVHVKYGSNPVFTFPLRRGKAFPRLPTFRMGLSCHVDGAATKYPLDLRRELKVRAIGCAFDLRRVWFSEEVWPSLNAAWWLQNGARAVVKIYRIIGR